MNLFENLQMIEESDDLSGLSKSFSYSDSRNWHKFTSWIKTLNGVISARDNFTNTNDEFWIECYDSYDIADQIENKYPELKSVINILDDFTIIINTDWLNIPE